MAPSSLHNTLERYEPQAAGRKIIGQLQFDICLFSNRALCVQKHGLTIWLQWETKGDGNKLYCFGCIWTSLTNNYSGSDSTPGGEIEGVKFLQTRYKEYMIIKTKVSHKNCLQNYLPIINHFFGKVWRQSQLYIYFLFVSLLKFWTFSWIKIYIDIFRFFAHSILNYASFQSATTVMCSVLNQRLINREGKKSAPTFVQLWITIRTQSFLQNHVIPVSFD